MNLTELITSANARGHIGIRGTFPGQGDMPVVNRALDLGLIRLVSAWRSTENDLPIHWGVSVDRRVYALTHKGWDLKINARDTLPSYKASALAEALAAHYGELEALAAHYGELEEGPDLRYPEEAFDPTEEHPRVVMTEDGVLHDTPYPGRELKVPDDHWLPPMRYPSPWFPSSIDWAWACGLLAAITLLGWWWWLS